MTRMTPWKRSAADRLALALAPLAIAACVPQGEAPQEVAEEPAGSGDPGSEAASPEDSTAIRAAALRVVEDLAAGDWKRLPDHVHPEEGVRISPHPGIPEATVRFSAEEVARLGTGGHANFNWWSARIALAEHDGAWRLVAITEDSWGP